MLAFFGRVCYYVQAVENGKQDPGVAKFGIALEWGSRGLEFESRHSDQKYRKSFCSFGIFHLLERFEKLNATRMSVAADSWTEAHNYFCHRQKCKRISTLGPNKVDCFDPKVSETIDLFLAVDICLTVCYNLLVECELVGDDLMYYHASSVEGITVLEPRISNHKTPLIYFSKKRENVLVYLSNAVEKYCKETNFPHDGIWQKWASYGFDKDGMQRIEEYYPNALEKTYKGVSGYIYTVESIDESGFDLQIPDAAASSTPVRVLEAEYVPDAYLAILDAERNGSVRILRYEEMTEKHQAWLEKTIKKEYEESIDHPEYRHFLRGNFPSLIG